MKLTTVAMIVIFLTFHIGAASVAVTGHGAFDSPLPPPPPPPCNEFYHCIPTPDPFVSPVEQTEQETREPGEGSRVSQEQLERGACIATARHYGAPESLCE